MKLFFFTGAGVSAESGIPTYRDSDNGLWYNYKVEEVATHYAWQENPAKVLEFFNMMRKKLDDYKPNQAHNWIAELGKHHTVVVVTQNIDDLHEQAGSHNVIHLHGCLKNKKHSHPFKKAILHPYDGDIKIGDLDPDYGTQFRPDVVLFGESVPYMGTAARHVDESDALIIIGTTLEVFPAANIVNFFLHDKKPIFYIDPAPNPGYGDEITYIEKKASEGILDVIKALETLNK